MEFKTTFNSKLLLFGEYGLMFDAMALSVPFPKFSGKLAFDETGKHPESTAEIQKFYEHLKLDDSTQTLHFSFDLERLGTDLHGGLYFDSNIPLQYGVGSSGALVAALFSKYAFPVEMGNNLSPEILKANFALLESFFHGKSSGLDPLVSYLNKPLLIDSRKQIVPIDFDLTETGIAIALIDTHTTGATGPLVQHFIDLFNLSEFKLAFENQFIPSNNDCIDSLQNGDKEHFFLKLERLIRFQVYHFHQMIPIGFHRVISHAICCKVYIKLLGSGGGGFLLVFAESKERLESWAAKENFQLIHIEPAVY
jgi:mevalonate kinase